MKLPAKLNSAALPVHKQKGFTLLEALVAFLILSIGMLGIGSLQLISLKAGHTAALRTVAVIKVEEMFERIRNNPEQVSNYDSTATAAANNNCNDYSTVIICTPEDLVAYDVYEWEAELEGILADDNDNASLTQNSGVTTSIVVTDPVAGTQPLALVVVTVNWQERDPETQAMKTMTYSASADICASTAC